MGLGKGKIFIFSSLYYFFKHSVFKTTGSINVLVLNSAYQRGSTSYHKVFHFKGFKYECETYS